jgi:hypothetical protein
MRQTVIVTLAHEPDTGIRGVLWAARGGWFVLRNAAMLRPNADPVPFASGEVVIPRANVAYLIVSVTNHGDR